MDAGEFRAYLAAELGERAMELETVAPSQQGERTDLGEETSRHDDGKSPPRKQERLRAILRAPEVVQQMYREGRISQADAARMGPKSPTPEQAAKVAEARQEIERIPASCAARESRQRAKAAIVRAFAIPQTGSLEQLRTAWERASPADRLEFLRGLDGELIEAWLAERGE